MGVWVSGWWLAPHLLKLLPSTRSFPSQPPPPTHGCTRTLTGMLLSIERTDPSDPIRNVRVLMPGFERQAEAGDVLHPLQLDFLRPFGLIRFMGEWMRES